ncbi:MAG: serine/threonine-protein kinase [Myxococcota bacterium]
MPDLEVVTSATPVVTEPTGSRDAQRIDRYVVLETVGQGGMGTVVRAYDPKLRREVALKRLHSASLDTESAARLVREAQALAQLSHPNVVAVYDVEAENEDVLVAMEFVPGRNLAHWLRTERTWQQTIEVLLQAGRGLEAAHAAHLIHRDFKPSNVMLSDAGEVKVTDFGLAKVGGTSRMDDSVVFTSHHPSIDPEIAEATEDLTRDDVMLGTPPYMAPEQHAGTDCSPATDQYAFCLTLWHALAGRRPFRGNVRQLYQAKQQGPPAWPRQVAVPKRLADAVRRGLQPLAKNRWPSMTVLLAEIERAVRPRASRVRPLMAAGVFGAGLASVVWLQTERDVRCEGAEAQLEGVWDDTMRDAVRGSMEDAAPLAGPAVWARVSSRLDTFTTSWESGFRDACEATSVRGEQSPAMLDLRMACLGRAKDSLRARVQRLLEVDARTVSRAVDVVDALPDLARCSDLDELSGERPLPTEPLERAAFGQAQADLADARALYRLARYDEALSTARSATVSLAAQGLAPRAVHAELLQQEALALEGIGRYDEAETTMREAVSASLAAAADEVAVDSLTGWSFVLESRLNRAEEAMLPAELAEEIARREEDPVMTARAVGRIAKVLDATGKSEAAEVRFKEALALLEAPEVDDPLALSGSLSEFGAFLQRRRRPEESLPPLVRALEIREEVLGSEHPYVCSTLSNIAYARQLLGDLQQAESDLVRALEICEQAFGSDHPRTATTKGNLAMIVLRAGELDRAAALFEEVRAWTVDTYGLEHAKTAEIYNNLGALHHQRGKVPEARAMFEQADASWSASLSADDPRLRPVKYNLGLVNADLGDHEDAIRYFRAALAVAPGAPARELAGVRFELAKSLVQVDRLAHGAEADALAADALVVFEAEADALMIDEAKAWQRTRSRG